MQIANPIYDVVFKYLMKDTKISKLLISAIIGEEIESLDFRPQEFTTDVEGRIGLLTVCRLNFIATINSSAGRKQVLIELQKAKYATDITRFKEYLDREYSDKNNTQLATINNHELKIRIPIIGIYFLEHKLDSTDASIIGVNRSHKDLVTGDLLTVKESFIESLTHDSYVIQIPQLAQKRRNELEILLSIFDQSIFVDMGQHFLNIKEEDYPDNYRPIIHRLQAAILELEIRKQIEIEDGILDDFENMQRELLNLSHKIAEAKQGTDGARQETAQARREADEARPNAAESDRIAEEARQETAKIKREADEGKKTVARNLKAAGVALTTIMQATGLSREEIENV